MHEYSIIESLLSQVDEIAKSNNAESVKRIFISIGERSGVDCALLARAFESFKAEFESCIKAELDIKIEFVELTCITCGRSFGAKGLNYARCVFCQSKDVKITKGRDMLLLSLELE